MAISIPWTPSERGGDDACDATPILHALFRTAIPRRGIGGRPIPASSPSPAPGARSRPALLPAPARRADTLRFRSMGGGSRPAGPSAPPGAFVENYKYIKISPRARTSAPQAALRPSPPAAGGASDLNNTGWLSHELRTVFVFWLSRFPGPHRSLADMTPLTAPRSCTPSFLRRFRGAGSAASPSPASRLR